MGIYAGDQESYSLFSTLFTPIIQEYHGLGPGQTHWEEMAPIHLAPLDPEGRFIRSVRIRVARNLADFPFCPHIPAQDRLALEQQVLRCLDRLASPLSGEYIRYADLDPAALDRLVAQRTAFPRGDRFQEAAGMNRDFPLGRGVFMSQDRTFRVWINEEDHLRIMAQEQGPDLGGIYRTLCLGLMHLSRSLAFSFDPALGFLNACPTNLGTAMRASAHICLPKLANRQSCLRELVCRHHLQVRGTRGEKTAVEEAVFDISNTRRLGLSANTLLKDLHHGLQDLIAAETRL